MTQSTEPASPLNRTPLYDLHLEQGAKMVPFAGYAMPVNYPLGILGEHLHVRESAGLFDVSHMGQAILSAPSDIAALVERLVPGELAALKTNHMRYTQFLNAEGGILDDLMITRLPDDRGVERLFLVVNAACKDADFAHIRKALPEVNLTLLENRALVALQGPKSVAVLARQFPGIEDMPFMSMTLFPGDSGDIYVSRCGYTGEDGFEISLPAQASTGFIRELLKSSEVAMIGLGARDSLRLEAGLCLYGHDIDQTTSPIEAGLVWSISKRRRAEGGFPGAARIQGEIENGPARKLVGILPEGRAPAREGTEILGKDGKPVGIVTSGGFAPTRGGPIAMGYVSPGYSATGAQIDLLVRGKVRPAQITALPFVPHRYHRSK